MREISLSQFKRERHTYNLLVAETPDIDRFCSSTYWILPAYEALSHAGEVWVRGSRTNRGYVVLARGYHESIGHYLQPLEASWGLASPLVGTKPAAVAREFAFELGQKAHQWDTLFLTGLNQKSPQFKELVKRLRRRYFVGIGPSMTRQFASLSGGLEGFLSRRSSKFRSNLRRAREEAKQLEIDYQYLAEFDGDPDEVFDRIMRVEKQSWKGEKNAGITRGSMRQFYRHMIRQLAEADALRVIFGRHEDRDIAYCFGGLFESGYRGLQMSYDTDYREYSPGNLLQVEMIEHLADEGIETYDMGQAMDYKSRWTEKEFTTVALIVRQ